VTVEGQLLWEPSPHRREEAVATAYAKHLEATRGLTFADPQQLWQWSVTDLGDFWDSVWEFGQIVGERGTAPALADDQMPGARWYPDARLNYTENVLRHAGQVTGPAVIARREDGRHVELSWSELRDQVGRAAAGLRRLGVGQGDRVCAVLPTSEHAVVAFLATASLGAIWSSCSPDFGATSLADRFAQIEPTVLIGVDGYYYNGKPQRTLDRLATLREQLPGLRATVLIPYLEESRHEPSLPGAIFWSELLSTPADPAPVRVPFDAPLWILYSSGTTGLPKAIVQGHGGIILEHVKALALHGDLRPGSRFFWFTTTGWMMWNYLVSGLLVGATIVCFDGSPAYPDLGALWRLAADTRVDYFGASAPYLASCMSAGIRPADAGDLSCITAVGSTGAPLSPEGFAWVYDQVGRDVLLASASGGTDVCTAFALGLPLLPVHAGELQTRGFGCAVAAYDAAGRQVIDEVGELVVTRPMPSMPVFFWGDATGEKLRDSYFATYPGVWRHGDWCKITPRGSLVIYGRSDSTLNRGGVRIGTAEFYRVVDQLPQIEDSLVVDTGALGREGRLLLFVVAREGSELDDELLGRLRTLLRTELSPRHVPDEIVRVSGIPRTLNGKKLEVPVKRLLAGDRLEDAVSAGAVANPETLEEFSRYGRRERS
jgi:acetoacetyl-CoA synthetase